MATRKLKVLLNIGTDHQKKYGIPNGEDGENPPQEGEVITVEEKLADILVHSLKCCKVYDADEEKAHADSVRKEDAARMASTVAQEAATEQTRKDAEKLLKGK